MRYFLFASILFCMVSTASAWSKKAVESYRQSATYKDLLCGPQKDKNFDCDYYSLKLGTKITQKPLSVSGSTNQLNISIGARDLVVSSDEETHTYIINGRAIKIDSLENTEELRASIRNLIPRLNNHRASLWITQAFADTESETLDLEIMATLQYLIIESEKITSCQALEEFLEKCAVGNSVLGRAILQINSGKKLAPGAERNAYAKQAAAYAQELNKLAEKVEGKFSKLNPLEIEKCEPYRAQVPVNTGKSGSMNASPYEACVATSKQYSLVFKKLKMQLDLGKVETLTRSRQHKKEASHSSSSSSSSGQGKSKKGTQ